MWFAIDDSAKIRCNKMTSLSVGREFFKLSRVLSLLAVMTVIVGGFGCSMMGSDSIKFTFESVEKTNDSRSMYVVIRTVNNKDFMIESYDQIADMVYGDSPEQGFIVSYVILPGKEKNVTITKPEDSAIAVYALFTQPGKKWKMLIKAPFEKAYDIKLLDNSIE